MTVKEAAKIGHYGVLSDHRVSRFRSRGEVEALLGQMGSFTDVVILGCRRVFGGPCTLSPRIKRIGEAARLFTFLCRHFLITGNLEHETEVL